MEHVVSKYTFIYINENQLLSPLQSSFTPGDSTVNELVNAYHMLCEALDKEQCKSDGFDSSDQPSNIAQIGQCETEIWGMNSKNNRESLPCPRKLCV